MIGKIINTLLYKISEHQGMSPAICLAEVPSRRRRMPELAVDDKGFTCECGIRNDYPSYVEEHRGVKLLYSCTCSRQYVLYRGKVEKVPRVVSEYSESDAFGD